jgi:transketolase
MRKQFARTAHEILNTNEQAIVLLGDIGVFGFMEAMRDHPDRVLNIGILEQSTISLAAGLSIEGMIPIVHTIAPFMVERALEQIKIDFGYQRLRGNLVSVGGSLDYAALGGTHHCPGDVSILLSVPNIEIVIPGTASEFRQLFMSEYNNASVTYYRLSESENSVSHDVKLGQATIVRSGNQATVVCIGPTLDMTLKAVENFDVSVIYMTSIRPFDYASIRQASQSGRVLIVEPFYEGTLTHEVVTALSGTPSMVSNVGIPRSFRFEYGTREEHYAAINFSTNRIIMELEKLLAVS